MAFKRKRSDKERKSMFSKLNSGSFSMRRRKNATIIAKKRRRIIKRDDLKVLRAKRFTISNLLEKHTNQLEKQGFKSSLVKSFRITIDKLRKNKLKKLNQTDAINIETAFDTVRDENDDDLKRKSKLTRNQIRFISKELVKV